MHKPLYIGGSVVLAVVAFIAGKALATGAPAQTPLTFAGSVTDQAGKPYAAAVDVSVAMYDAASAGNLKCKSATVQAEAGSGRFSVVLPAECAQAVHATPDLWSEVAVGPNKLLMPRSHVGALPFALEADAASVASTAKGLQCQGCVKVEAMLFDKDVDLAGHTLTAGKLDLGPTVGDELGSAQVKTLTGGGNADALHTHAGGTGGGGQVIKFKGVTSTTFLGNAGVPAINKQCAAEYGAARMCNSAMLDQMFPFPSPSAQAWLLLDGTVSGYGFQTAYLVAFGRVWTLGQEANCMSGANATPFNYFATKGLTIDSQGAVVLASCNTAIPALCCGP